MLKNVGLFLGLLVFFAHLVGCLTDRVNLSNHCQKKRNRVLNRNTEIQQSFLLENLVLTQGSQLDNIYNHGGL